MSSKTEPFNTGNPRAAVDQRSAGDVAVSPVGPKRRPFLVRSDVSPVRDNAVNPDPRSCAALVRPQPSKPQKKKKTEPVNSSRSNPSSRPPLPRQSKGPFGGRRSTDALPPYLRASLAEQLAPVCTRPARENTQETLFGPMEPKAPARPVRAREDTQSTLFGEPDPLAVKRPSRSVKDNTQNNLFGPPPEFRHRTSVRLPADTVDILHHEDRRPSGPTEDAQLQAIVGRYFLRYQDTQDKLFGGPVASKPPPERQASNVFWFETRSKSSPEVEHRAVDTLPLPLPTTSQKPVESSSSEN